jgi:hypothetical protein
VINAQVMTFGRNSVTYTLTNCIWYKCQTTASIVLPLSSASCLVNFYSNTFYKCGGSYTFFYGYAANPNLVLKNNIFANYNTNPYFINNLTAASHTYNTYYMFMTDCSPAMALDATEHSSGIYTTTLYNPMFIDAEGGDLRLSKYSEAIGSGAVVP